MTWNNKYDCIESRHKCRRLGVLLLEEKTQIVYTDAVYPFKQHSELVDIRMASGLIDDDCFYYYKKWFSTLD